MTEARALPTDTLRFLEAHGNWVVADPVAASIAGQVLDEAPAHLEALAQAGWLLDDGRFSPSARAWMQANLAPTAAMVDRASVLAEQDFLSFRLHGRPLALRGQVDRWASWSDDDGVTQWAQLAQDALVPERACEACRFWATVAAYREADAHGWTDRTARMLSAAATLADNDVERFIVSYLTAVHGTYSEDVLTALQRRLPSEAYQLYVHQARAAMLGRAGQPVTDELHRAVDVAHRHGLMYRELHLRQLLAHDAWPDTRRMRAELEPIAMLGVHPSGAELGVHRWLWLRLTLAEGDLDGAVHIALTILDEADAHTRATVGRAWAVICVDAVARGDTAGAEAALRRARSSLLGSRSRLFLDWAERAHGGGPLRPLPYETTAT